MVFNEAPELHPDLPTNFPTCQKDMELDDDEFQTYYNTPYGQKAQIREENKTPYWEKAQIREENNTPYWEKAQIREENNTPYGQKAQIRGENNGKFSLFFFILLVQHFAYTSLTFPPASVITYTIGNQPRIFFSCVPPLEDVSPHAFHIHKAAAWWLVCLPS